MIDQTRGDVETSGEEGKKTESEVKGNIQNRESGMNEGKKEGFNHRKEKEIHPTNNK